MPQKLHLVVKAEYYDAIEKGDKTVEYRDNTPYWHKRIIEKQFQAGDIVVFHRGFTKKTMEFFIESIWVCKPRIDIHLGGRAEDLYSLK